MKIVTPHRECGKYLFEHAFSIKFYFITAFPHFPALSTHASPALDNIAHTQRVPGCFHALCCPFTDMFESNLAILPLSLQSSGTDFVSRPLLIALQ